MKGMYREKLNQKPCNGLVRGGLSAMWPALVLVAGCMTGGGKAFLSPSKLDLADGGKSLVDDSENVPINVPIKGAIDDKVREAIARTPGINRGQLAKELQVDVKTIGRAIAALAG